MCGKDKVILVSETLGVGKMHEEDTIGWLLLLGSLAFVGLLLLWEPVYRTYAKLGSKRDHRARTRNMRAQ